MSNARRPPLPAADGGCAGAYDGLVSSVGMGVLPRAQDAGCRQRIIDRDEDAAAATDEAVWPPAFPKTPKIWPVCRKHRLARKDKSPA
jgi:hypothetical protein